MESGVYYGWAGLSKCEATTKHPPANTESKYKLMSEGIFDYVTQMLLLHRRKSKKSEEQNLSREKGAVYPMVMSIGWNPYYKNTVRSVEVHIMDDFKEDFYDTHMNLVILGFIRPEYDYVSVDSLVDDIKTDIDVAGRSLARDEYVKFAEDPYLLDFSEKSEIAS